MQLPGLLLSGASGQPHLSRPVVGSVSGILAFPGRHAGASSAASLLGSASSSGPLCVTGPVNSVPGEGFSCAPEVLPGQLLCSDGGDGGQGRAGEGSPPEGATPPAFLVSEVTSAESFVPFETLAQRKSRAALMQKVEDLRLVFGLERLAVHTLTFRKDIKSMKTAQRHFRQLFGYTLPDWYFGQVWNVERSKRKVIHFHMVVVFPVGVDVRTGFDFASLEGAKKEKEAHGYTRRWRELTNAYSATACPALKAVWAFFRKLSERHGCPWGRSEIVPVISAEGVANYLGSYLTKHIAGRLPEDKGFKLHGASVSVRSAIVPAAKLPAVPFGQGRQGERLALMPKHQAARYSLADGYAWVWRRKVAVMVERLGFNLGDEFAACAEMTACFGRSWSSRFARIFDAFTLGDMVEGVVYPSGLEYNADHQNHGGSGRPFRQRNIPAPSGGVHPAFRAEIMRLRGEVLEWRKRKRCSRKRAAELIPPRDPKAEDVKRLRKEEGIRGGLSRLVHVGANAAREGAREEANAVWSRLESEEEKPFEAWKVDGIEGALLTEYWFSDFGSAHAAAVDCWQRGIGIGSDGAVAIMGRRGRTIETFCLVRAGPF